MAATPVCHLYNLVKLSPSPTWLDFHDDLYRENVSCDRPKWPIKLVSVQV